MPARIVLATLNAKYIHASLGLRYLLANMERHGSAQLLSCTHLREYTIHRPAQDIVEDLLAALGTAERRIVGFGVYIWNVAQTAEVLRLLRQADPGVTIVLGGPEVSHEWQAQDIVQLADYVITGWGDVSFPRLCWALLNGPRPLMKIIPGEQPPLEQIALPYAHYSERDLAQRVLYVEASRGCPFRCEFCLSALDKTAWAFELERFLLALDDLYARGARQFKFVDRTFNLKLQASSRILMFFLQRLQAQPEVPLALHFELVPDQLPQGLKDLIVQFPPGVLQLEIGIQSLNPEVQQRIARKQDNEATAANLAWLRTHSQAHLHTDLIFGLPGESWESFARGFDRLYALGPHEIQLGVLKRLRGTPLAQGASGPAPRHPGMVFSSDPPYTVQSTDAVSAQQLQRFNRLARYWDLVANSGRFPRTLPLLTQGPSAFAALADFSDWLWQRHQATHRITPEALVDALFDYLSIQRSMPLEQVRASLCADYLASGARAMPRCLQGHLPHRPPRSATAHKRAAALPSPAQETGQAAVHKRQQRHHAGQTSKASHSKIDP